MRYFGRIPALHIVAIAVAMSVLTSAVVSGFCFIQASRNAAQMESDIVAAQGNLTKHEESLRETIALTTGIEQLSLSEAKRAARTALRHRDTDAARFAIVRLYARFGKYVDNPGTTQARAQSVSPELAAAVTQAALQYFGKAAEYQSKLTKVKAAYALELDSGWGGMWMRMAGYPTISLSVANPRIGLPEIDATPTAADSAPVTADSSTPAPAKSATGAGPQNLTQLE
jgi:hypothetical protein